MGIMTRRFRTVWVACSVGICLLPLAITVLPSATHAQSADLVLCDRLAADPTDPDKPADVKGAPEIAPSDIATAIKFCRVASTGSRRALYQLGRAYAANRQLAEAISAYRKAADRGSTSAMVELGVLLATGSGVPEDKSRHASCSSARRRRAIRAASPISPPSRTQAPHRRIPRRRGRCLRRRRIQIRQKRSISSD